MPNQAHLVPRFQGWGWIRLGWIITAPLLAEASEKSPWRSSVGSEISN
jgi:hypothetical protein